MFGPRNLEEAKRYRYGRRDSYNPNYCAAEVRTKYMTDQCFRKPGHGPDKIFCKQHAAMREKEK